MRMTPMSIPDVLLLEPRVMTDERGHFLESWNAREFAALLGASCEFVQDNHSCSHRGVLRGLHFQLERPQGKLVRVVGGRIFDVAVDLRRASPTFGCWAGAELSAENRRMMWVPPGFAHGFLALSGLADVLYKTTDYYHPASERALRWDDPALAIAWPLHELDGGPLLSARDRDAPGLDGLDIFP